MQLKKSQTLRKGQQKIMNEQVSFDLKMTKVSLEENVNRGDLVYVDGGIWMCASKASNTFTNMQDKEKREIKESNVVKLNKLQLIPIKWEVIDQKVFLEGRELGMGPTHKLSISWLRAFEEMNMIAKAKEHGRQLRNKVILCETTKPRTYLIVGIELM